jgi:hypothetical protein
MYADFPEGVAQMRLDYMSCNAQLDSNGIDAVTIIE